MKKNRLIFTSLLMLLCLLLVTSCNKKPKDTNDITTFLKSVESYTTDMSMEVKNDRQIINYNATQSYLRGGGYKLELNSDRVFLYKTDGNIYVSDKKSGTKYIQSEDFDEVFKLSFIGEYIGLLYTNEEIKYSIENKNGIEYTVINLFIPGSNKNINNALLYVNTKSMIPEKMIIYDIKGKEKIHITYTKFLPNVKVEASQFLIP